MTDLPHSAGSHSAAPILSFLCGFLVILGHGFFLLMLHGAEWNQRHHYPNASRQAQDWALLYLLFLVGSLVANVIGISFSISGMVARTHQQLLSFVAFCLNAAPGAVLLWKLIP